MTPSADLKHHHLPQFGPGRRIANRTELRAIRGEIVEPGFQHENPQRERCCRILEFQVLVQSDEKIKLARRLPKQTPVCKAPPSHPGNGFHGRA